MRLVEGAVSIVEVEFCEGGVVVAKEKVRETISIEVNDRGGSILFGFSVPQIDAHWKCDVAEGRGGQRSGEVNVKYSE